MNLRNVLVAICSLLLITVGIDKFIPYLEPPCSLMNEISPTIWKGLGVLQILGGILIWLPKFSKYVAGFFIIFMLFFTLIHLKENTYDVGGAVFMAIAFGVLLWNPKFLRGKAASRK